VSLTRRAAQAAAHDSEDEASLRDLQEQVADALIDRLPGADDLPLELLMWEAELFHVAETPPDTCLICRKASRGLPTNMPLPGLARPRR
jgi:hypothetical protein